MGNGRARGDTTLADWAGTWQGTWSTWLEPGVLHDTSPIEMDIAPDGGWWHTTYRGSIGGDAVSGSLAVSGDGRTFRWADTWHTAGVEHRLDGDATAPPSYTYGPTDEPWRWSIDIRATAETLVISHTNAPPDGTPAEAVRMVFAR